MQSKTQAWSPTTTRRQTASSTSGGSSTHRTKNQDAIDSAPKKRLEEPRARFYAAEIALALMHLHDMGLMYR